MNRFYCFLTFVLICFNSAAAYQTDFFRKRLVSRGFNYEVVNSANYAGSGKYNWTLFILAPKRQLDKISYVEYTLHPSLPNPIRKAYDPDSNFSIDGFAYAEFDVYVLVMNKNGEGIYVTHRLTLREKSIEDIKTEYSKAHSHQVIKFGYEIVPILGSSSYEWTVFVEADEELLNSIKQVNYTYGLFHDFSKVIYDRGNESGKGFFFNGETSELVELEISVVFRDGDVQYLNHTLYSTEKEKREKLSNYLQEALYYYNIGDYGKASYNFDLAGDEAIDKEIDYFHRGYSYAKEKQYRKGIDSYEKFLDKTEGTQSVKQAHNNIGAAYLSLDNLKMAEESFNEALNTDHNYPLAYYNLASVYEMLGNLSHAETGYLNAINLDPKNSQYHLALGLLYSNQNRFDETVSEYSKALEYDANNSLAQNNLAYLYAEKGKNLEEADILINRALKNDPNNPYYMDTKGWIQFGLKNYNVALDLIEKAAKKLPNNRDVQNHLWIVQDSLNFPQTIYIE